MNKFQKFQINTNEIHPAGVPLNGLVFLKIRRVRYSYYDSTSKYCTLYRYALDLIFRTYLVHLVSPGIFDHNNACTRSYYLVHYSLVILLYCTIPTKKTSTTTMIKHTIPKKEYDHHHYHQNGLVYLIGRQQHQQQQ